MADQSKTDPYEEFGGKVATNQGADPYEEFGGKSSASSATPESPFNVRPGTSAGEQAKDVAVNVAVGAAKGFGHTLGGLAPAIHSIPVIGQTLAPEEGIRAWEGITRPEGTAQKAGYYGEQAGEFLIPGEAEDKAAMKVAEYAPALGKFAAPLARIGVNALSTGAINKLQGGEFSTGAETGAGTSTIGEGAKLIAPKVAETALRITDQLRGRGRTIGDAAINELSSIRPSSLAAEAGTKLKSLTGEMEGGVHDATASGAIGSTAPAHQALNNVIQRTPRNATDVVQKLQSLTDSLGFPGQAARTAYNPDELLEMKRGIGQTINTWPREWQQNDKVKAAKIGLYSAIDHELDNLVPNNDELNQRISSIIPIQSQAKRISLGAPLSQRVANRIARPTGALIAGTAGEEIGRRKYGLPGAIAGGAAGLMLPEIIASPSVEMLGARALNSPAFPRITGAFGLQMDRDQNKDKEKAK